MKQQFSFFDMPHNYNTNLKRKEQVSMNIIGYEKLHVTAMLYIIVNSNEFPPYIILNRKTVPEENFCKKANNYGPKNACMAFELMKNWLECIGTST
jgi:hypothetical protein